MLGTGKSFRTSKEGELIKHGLGAASVSGDAHMHAGTVRLSCTITSGGRGVRKVYTLNGEPVRYAKFLGSAKVVTFAPADLQLVSGPPRPRRAMLNVALSQDQPLYYSHLARYQKALTQKAALLRGAVGPDPDLLGIYNQTLIDAGTALMQARIGFIAALDTQAHGVYRGWVGGSERLSLRYEPSIPIETSTRDALACAFAARLAVVADVEAARKLCIAGPHRDDLAFELDGRSLAAFGSQGQQRMAVLALKVAEYMVMSDRSGEAPLLFLDDVLSELDHHRARAFLAGVGRFEQAFMTATALPRDLPAAAEYRIADATLERIA